MAEERLIFDEDDIRDGDETSFSAVFVNSEYYRNLLSAAELHFGLDLLSKSREIPIMQIPYMLLDNHVGSSRLLRCLGKKYFLSISELIYHRALCVVVAIVKLDKNFTCSVKPHIVLAKNKELPSRVINELLDGKFEHLGPDETKKYVYDEPFKLKHCRIGVMLNSNLEKGDYYKHTKPEEQKKKVTRVTMDGGVPVITEIVNTDYIRPELMHVVERAPESLSIPNGNGEGRTSSDGGSIVSNVEPTMYRGRQLYKGGRGKYYYINSSGAKIYPQSVNNSNGGGGDGSGVNSLSKHTSNVIVRIKSSS